MKEDSNNFQTRGVEFRQTCCPEGENICENPVEWKFLNSYL